MFLSLILKSSMKTKAEDRITIYFIFLCYKSLKMVTDPLFNITKEFVILLGVKNVT